MPGNSSDTKEILLSKALSAVDFEAVPIKFMRNFNFVFYQKTKDIVYKALGGISNNDCRY